MNDVQLVFITWNGATVFRYVTGAEPGDANAEAGFIMDRLSDQFGAGFGYRVEAVPYRQTCDNSAVREAANAYACGIWPPAEERRTCESISRAAARLRELAAEMESGI